MLADSQLAKELKLKITTYSNNRETVNDNIPLTVRNMKAQTPK